VLIAKGKSISIGNSVIEMHAMLDDITKENKPNMAVMMSRAQ
jgi:hypothetical protein